MRVLKKIAMGLISIIVIIIINIGAGVSIIRLGLFPNIQIFIVNSTMTTLSHQYIANIFASDEDIKKIREFNRVVTDDEKSDKAAFNIGEEDDLSVFNPSTNKKNAIELVNIDQSRFKAHMFIIGDPKRVKLGVAKNIGTAGAKLNDIIRAENGIGGINAGGFMDDGGHGNGGTPTGIIVKDGQVLWKDGTQSSYNIIGFDYEGFLTLGNYTIDQISKMKIKDAVSFGPYLIVNNKPTTIIGDGGWGLNPRTVIGQKKDGTVLMLIVDGRQISSVGATIKEIQNIMISYGAINAANLDGGSSTVMYYNDKLVNKPCSPYGERPLPTAFIIAKGDGTGL
jgi:exopolysaccharide biosynthesis protein